VSQAHYITVKPLHKREIEVGPYLFSHERYVGFFAESHLHPAIQVTLPLSGRMHLTVGDRDFMLGPESVIVLPAEVPHSVTYLDGELEFLCISTPMEWLEQATRALGLPTPGAREAWTVSEPFLWPLARHLALEVDAPTYGTEGLLRSGLQQLEILLGRASLRGSDPEKGQQDPRILRAVDRMIRDYSEDLSVEELARGASMTTRHFERCFKQAIGTTPKRYLLEVRMAIARKLLETSEAPVTAIALDLGFSSSSHFIETFRRLVGVSPAAYRSAQRP